MLTLRLRVPPDGLLTDASAQDAVEQAAAILRGGGTVALPTETVYGLGANALDPAAVARIFAAKERPNWDPLIVHIADEAMLATLVTEIPVAARRLMEAYWPGPLTLLLPRSSAVPDAVTAGRALVGIRMPAHPVALEVIRRAGVPIAAPSANRFGHTSPTTAQHVLDDLDGRIDAVLDAGPTAFGLESTVVDPNQSPLMIYRPGGVTLEQVRAIAGPAELYRDTAVLTTEPREALLSPGVGLRHYAPNARLILIEAEENPSRSVAEVFSQQAAMNAPERIGLMLPSGIEGVSELVPDGYAAVFEWGDWARPEELAHRLFAGLRYLDDRGCAVILCPVPPAAGIGAAIRDRLRKAATL